MERLERVSEEVFYARNHPVIVGRRELEFLKREAATTKRRRARICTHPDTDAPLHEMFIVHHRDAYVRPHAHRTKAESFSLVEGESLAVFFDPSGAVISSELMSREDPSGKQYYRVEAGAYHTLLIQSEWLVFHEVAGGPFRAEETDFPGWAPEEADENGARRYMDSLRARLSGAIGIKERPT